MMSEAKTRVRGAKGARRAIDLVDVDCGCAWISSADEGVGALGGSIEAT